MTIGVVLVTEATRTAPKGVRDSKLLTPESRRRLVPRIKRWAAAWGVGHASPREIDSWGMTAAMRLAGHRALVQLGVEVDSVLLDGNHDYLSPPAQADLFAAPSPLDRVPPVLTMVKADLKCAAVAAASILAKTTRDEIMVRLDAAHPHYRWAENKGYSAPAHVAALTEHGPSEHHRLSWRLPGTEPADTVSPPVHRHDGCTMARSRQEAAESG